MQTERRMKTGEEVLWDDRVPEMTSDLSQDQRDLKQNNENQEQIDGRMEGRWRE